MPEYLAPGVFVEETSFRAKSIEGVSTTTTGFVGPTRYGPVFDEPDIITSLVEFERTYGDGERLEFAVEGGTQLMHNYMWHGARAFFEEGGRRLYVKRIYRPAVGATEGGHASAILPQGGVAGDSLSIAARYPGAAGSRRVRVTLDLGPNVLADEVVDGTTSPPIIRRRAQGVADHDIVVITNVEPGPPTSPPTVPPAVTVTNELAWAESYYDSDAEERTWRFHRQTASPAAAPIELSDLHPNPDPDLTDQIRVVTATVTVLDNEPGAVPQVWGGLPIDPLHERAGRPDSMATLFSPDPLVREARHMPISIHYGENVDTGLDVVDALAVGNTTIVGELTRDDSTVEQRSVEVLLTDGSDGTRPQAADYEGDVLLDDSKTGLKAFEDLEDISIVAAPGSTAGYESDDDYRDDAQTIVSHLINHATRMRYRIAVVDSGDNQTIQQVRAMRARYDSKYAAFYYPWVRVLDPITQLQIPLPPSGFVAGIYARNDIERAVWKAPANEVVNLALTFERTLNKSQQEVLNPEGVNCFRFFEGRGNRLWGARTMSSDSEWMYVNLRRYFAYLEHSIDRGTQWAVFESNGPQLWANVRRSVEDFLFNEFQMGALLGEKPERAYFVRCDRTTMTQNDLDNGRLVCLIGVAPLRPAEFVIFRIGQWTGDRK